MGTHPIFESDFDCLTDKQRMEAAGVVVATTVGAVIGQAVGGAVVEAGGRIVEAVGDGIAEAVTPAGRVYAHDITQANRLPRSEIEARLIRMDSMRGLHAMERRLNLAADIVIYSNWAVYGIRLGDRLYGKTERPDDQIRWHEIFFAPGETLSYIEFDRSTGGWIAQLTIVTNRRSYGPFGDKQYANSDLEKKMKLNIASFEELNIGTKDDGAITSISLAN